MFMGTNYGTFYREQYRALGDYAGAETGVFGVASQKTGGNAPTNIVNRSLVVTTVGEDFQLNFSNPATFTEVIGTDNSLPSEAGNYSYSRIAANLGSLNLNFTNTSPVESDAVLLQLVAPNFAVFTNAAGTLGTAVLK
jgi:hypothetical protein